MRYSYRPPPFIPQHLNSAHNRLHLVVPGLLGPFGRFQEQGITPRVPLLETLLAKAERQAARSGDHIATLFAHFGYEVPREADSPSAAICRLAEERTADDGFWLHADPVHLKPDMDRLLLFDGRTLEITRSEAQSLGKLLLEHFADQGWRLEQPAPERWYLQLPASPALVTQPLHRVTGRSVSPFLPEGADRRRWRGLLNEIQMLLYHAEVNQARRESGRPEINGLWLWGGGRLPDVKESGWQRVYADHPLAAGLARHTGVQHQGLPQRFDPREIEGECLMYREDPLQPLLDSDTAAWGRSLERLEPLLETLLGALRQRYIATLLLYPCNGHSYCITGAGLRRFWRRRRPITELLDGTASL